MFENLQEKLQGALKTLKGQGSISEINVAETVKEVRRALMNADVSYQVAKEFTDKVKKEALGRGILTTISPGQMMVKIMNDELTALMGSDQKEIDLSVSMPIVLIAGLQGSGKTTFTHKLGHYLKTKKKFKPLLVACDVYRPAAIEQLRVLSEKIQVPFYADLEEKNPVLIAQKSLEFAKEQGCNAIIIDTAGRLSIDEVLMKEVQDIKNKINPTDILFVVDAMTGQDAVTTAKNFNDSLDFSGVVLTKMDGDTRGGAALSIKYVVNKPIYYISNGEKEDSLDLFYPDRMANRILGMGDIVSLVEKAEQQFDAKKAAELSKKIAKNKFDFNDFRDQLQQIKKMGNIKDLLGYLPGVGAQLKDIDIDEKAFVKLEAMINSMTPKERANPEILDSSRKQRIAKGSGQTINQLNNFIKQFDQMKKMMKSMQNFNPKRG
ncbi:MAG: signal recognition particle protein [Chitinophagales bacterium]|jgi:signal recognition particle subunit SRP54|nr:signal recognition particle protein [Chitinophagales bacterium]